MGWTYTHKEKGQSVRDFFAREFDYSRENGSYGKIIACSSKLRTAYMAYEIGAEDGKRIIAIVCLLGHAPNSYYNFGYKDMDETMGPYESECPEGILKLLTPTDSEYAKQWRERCWNNITKKKAKPKLEIGMKVVFKEPLTFTDGSKHTELTITRLKPLRFKDRYGSLYRIKRETLYDRECEFIKQGGTV